MGSPPVSGRAGASLFGKEGSREISLRSTPADTSAATEAATAGRISSRSRTVSSRSSSSAGLFFFTLRTVGRRWAASSRFPAAMYIPSSILANPT
jgi:hypothetical protein